MAKQTGIAWTKSTFNPWIGCSKIGPGCDACYAEAQDQRFYAGEHWGAGAPRRRTTPKYWGQPLVWNKTAPTTEFAGRKGFWPVFCASQADVFDNEVPQAWRDDLWALIAATPNLSWQIVTKRIGNVSKMVPPDWLLRFPPNVRLIITVVNQEEADRDVPKLRTLNCKNGISYEPALGPVAWLPWLQPSCSMANPLGEPLLDWIIVGGESAQAGALPRSFDLEWARSTVAVFKAVGVPVFVKQLGSRAVDSAAGYVMFLHQGGGGTGPMPQPVQLDDRTGADPAEWPEELRVREFPL